MARWPFSQDGDRWPDGPDDHGKMGARWARGTQIAAPLATEALVEVQVKQHAQEQGAEVQALVAKTIFSMREQLRDIARKQPSSRTNW